MQLGKFHTKRRGIGAGRNARDSCGCAMGARFLAVALTGSSIWYGWQWQLSALSTGAALVRVLAVSFLASGVGKVFGIVRSRWLKNDDRDAQVER